MQIIFGNRTNVTNKTTGFRKAKIINANFPLFSVMRLGKKKEKDRDGEKEQCVEGVARLICSANKSHHVPLRGRQINHNLFQNKIFIFLASDFLSFNFI